LVEPREHARDGSLQNRRTGQVEVRPLSYRHAALFDPRLPTEDRVRAYGVWGGLPGYLRDVDPAMGLWDNIAHTLLRPDARLAIEPDWLRFTDLRADRLYTSLVRAIATGAHAPRDIARAVLSRSSSTIIENVFAVPGLGQLLTSSIFTRDLSVVQGITLIFALFVVCISLLTDVAYAALDPRVAYD
jgi:hypothetical protein